MTRAILPLLALATIGCRGGSDPTGTTGGTPALDLDMEWQANPGRIVMRLTDASSTDTEVRRALGRLFNGVDGDPSRPGIDPLQLLMRGASKDGTSWKAPESAPDADLLAGTSLEQALAFKNRVVDADDVFSSEEAVDACGNPVHMTLVTPEALATVMPEAPTTDLWPSSCAAPEGCEPVTGTWDVAIGERRADGMIDMVLNVLPVFETDPATPGVWGNLTALFFTERNLGLAAVPLFANMRRVQVNLTNVWQLHREFSNPNGNHEVYIFPHRARTLDLADIFVFAESYDKAEDFWAAEGHETSIPYGLEEGGNPVGVDTTAVNGLDVVALTNRDPMLPTALTDLVNYTLSASLACPDVREDAWLREGPIEFFLCADGDVDRCVAREDMHEAACLYPTEPTPDAFDPFPPNFPRVDAQSGSATVPPSDLPHYLDGSQPDTQITITVNADSSLYLKSDSVLTGVVGGGVTLPSPTTNSHCAESGMLRYDLGSAWPAGTYTLTVDLSAGEVDDPGTGGTGGETEPAIPATWFYYTDISTWVPN